MSEHLSEPPGSGTAFTAGWAGVFVALLSGMPIAVAVFFANQDGEGGPWMFALVVLWVGVVALLLGATLVLTRRPPGAPLITLGSLCVLAGSIGVTYSWALVYKETAYFVVAVAFFAAVALVLSVLPKTRAFLKHQRQLALSEST